MRKSLKSLFGIEETPENKSAVQAVDKAKEIKKLLGNSLPTLRKELPSYSAVDLETAAKLEELGKGRKTVLKLIKELITKQAKANVSKVVDQKAPSAKEFQKRQVLKGENKQLLSNLTNVRESDKEQVVIKIGDD